MVRHQKREFSIRDKRDERDSKRIHFDRLHKDPKKMTKPLWWLILILIVVIGILMYLNNVR
ncbi:MAG TPA: hypothetical protein DHW42_08970 [Candidatus Marinimicrobia bacterium]|nr:hypothetical protein [Candidatus Neomarinimicrobiota bacterium]